MLVWFKPIPFYLRIYKDRMVLKRLDTGTVVEQMANEPFTSTRLLIGHFPAASALLNGLIGKANDRVGPLRRKNSLVIHPMEMCEDGLSAVEHRAFLDLGKHSASAPVVVVLSPGPLTDPEVLGRLSTSG